MTVFIHRDDREHQDRLAAYLETLPVRVIAHLTFPHAVSDEEREHIFHRWLLLVQERHRTTVGFVVGYERWPVRHLHAVLFAHRPLNLIEVRQAFSQVVPGYQAGIEAEEYRRGGGGLAYTMKTGNTDGCLVTFSRNLHLFAPQPCAGGRPSNARSRRQARRTV